MKTIALIALAVALVLALSWEVMHLKNRVEHRFNRLDTAITRLDRETVEAAENLEALSAGISSLRDEADALVRETNDLSQTIAAIRADIAARDVETATPPTSSPYMRRHSCGRAHKRY